MTLKCINITNLFVFSHCLKYTRTAKHKGKKLKQNKILIFLPPLHIPSLLIFISQKSCIFLTKAKEYCSGLQLRFHTSDRSYKKRVSLTSERDHQDCNTTLKPLNNKYLNYTQRPLVNMIWLLYVSHELY